MKEVFGIAGTAFVIMAFACNSEKYIRILDAIGASLFVIYGLLTETWSTAILNIALIGIQIYKLLKRDLNNG